MASFFFFYKLLYVSALTPDVINARSIRSLRGDYFSLFVIIVGEDVVTFRDILVIRLSSLLP